MRDFIIYTSVVVTIMGIFIAVVLYSSNTDYRRFNDNKIICITRKEVGFNQPYKSTCYQLLEMNVETSQSGALK